MIEENRMNRYYYACSDETHSALMKISRGDSFIGNVLWASVYAIVNRVYFQTYETVIALADTKGDCLCAKLKLEGLENDNFFTVVKRVRDIFLRNSVSCKADIWIGRDRHEKNESKSIFWMDDSDCTKGKQFIWLCEEKEELIGVNTYFLRIFAKVALFLLKNPEKLIGQLSECFRDDFDKICNYFNDTERDYSERQSVYDEFVYQARENNEAVALIYEEKQYTYGKLLCMVNREIQWLKKFGVKEHDVVGVFLDSKIEQILSIFAILGCGAVYLPIEVTYPADRIQYMLEDSGAKSLICSSRFCQEEISFGGIQVIEARGICVENIDSLPIEELCIDTGIVIGDDSAYIMYTSGSTGRPKGVEICNKSILRLVKNNGFLDISAKDKILQTSTIVFDASIIEIYGSLLNGACLVLSNKQDIIDPKRIRKLIQDNHITIMWLSSPLFSQLSSQDPPMFSGVEHLMVGGDVLSPKHINTVRNCCEGIEIINGYGPTENTTFSTTYSIKEDYVSSIPIGRPIHNSTAYILNSKHELQPIGAIGEICVGGLGIAKGYLHNDELNKQKFINNPFGEGKLYLTGDNGFWTEEGVIEFTGRKDYQFKVNGFRVEMGEIEAEVLKCPGVGSTVALVEKIEGQNKIVLVYSGKENENIVKGFLKEHLPTYMFPNYVLHMDIPLNENGKIDRGIVRNRLVELEGEGTVVEQLSEIQRAVSDVVNSISNTKYIKLDDNLFELYFDSLKMAILITHLNDIFQSNLLFNEVYMAPTIRQVSNLLENKKTGEEKNLQKVGFQAKYSASPAQRRIFFASHSDKGEMSYNVPALFRFHKAVDISKIKDVWQQIIDRHEALRTRFIIDGAELFQVIDNPYEITVHTSQCDEDNLHAHVATLIKRFDLENGPLFCVNVISTEIALYMLVDIHHIVVDGFSENIIMNEFTNLFKGKALSDLEFQNKDIIYSRNLLFDDEVMKKQEQYWTSALGEVAISDDIITDYFRNSNKRIGCEKAYRIGDKITVDNIKDYSVQNNSTVFSILLACMYLTVWKYSDKQRILAGVPFSGRTMSGMNDVVGMFVNVMPVVAEVIPNETVDGFIKKVRDVILLSYENQEYQFDSLVEKLNIPREKNRNPLFNFSFNVTWSDDTYIIDEQGTNWLQTVDLTYDVVKFDFSIVVILSGTGISLKVQYDKTLYTEATISNFVNCYEKVLHCVLQDHRRKLCELDVASERDREIISMEFNNTKVHYGDFNNVIEALEATAKKYPNKNAVSYRDRSLTYKELIGLANTGAGFLQEMGVHLGDRVAILVENKLDQILSILAILSAGGVYVPIDVDYPKSRIRDILSNAGTKILMTDRIKDSLSFDGLATFTVEQMCTYEGNASVKLDTTPNSLAYIMYTSGTTGKPKGVMVNHKAIMRLIINTNFVHLNENDNLLQTSSIVFDASAFEIWSALMNGMTFYLSDKADLFDFERLTDIIRGKKISVMWLSAPLFRKIGQNAPECFNGLKWLLIGGDVVPKDVVENVKRACSGIRIIDGYGPTENTTFSTCFEIDYVDRKDIPIGKPINNSEVYILDAWKHLQPVGAVGEIFVGGDGLADGYSNDLDLTTSKFLEIDIGGISKRLYATGDMGYWMQDGNIVFLGRKDQQVKIRGFRIETEEIVQAALRNKFVNDAVVLAQKQEDSLALFCVCSDKGKDAAESSLENQIRLFLKRELPEFMVPRYIICLDSMPLNVNGKIETARLKEYLEDSQKQEHDICADIEFSTIYEKDICQIWNEILPSKSSNIDTNFFDAGGNSMYLMKVFDKLNEKYGKVVSMSELFVYTTIRELAQCFAQRLGTDNKPEEMKLKAGVLLPSPIRNSGRFQYSFSIEQERYQEFIEKLHNKTHLPAEGKNDKKQVIYNQGIFMLMWAMALDGVANENINFTVYDSINSCYVRLKNVLKSSIDSVDDLLHQYLDFMNQVSENQDGNMLHNLDFENHQMNLESARILFAIGTVPKRIRREFLITLCLIKQADRIVFEMNYDQERCADSVAEELLKNFSDITNYVMTAF